MSENILIQSESLWGSHNLSGTVPGQALCNSVQPCIMGLSDVMFYPGNVTVLGLAQLTHAFVPKQTRVQKDGGMIPHSAGAGEARG